MPPAAPVPHEETFHGIRLYERLTELSGNIRHGPSNTTWVFAFRGVKDGQPVILFRSADGLGDAPRELVEDVGRHAVASGGHWALVEAPPGVRLRALVLEAARRQRLTAALVLDAVVRTEQALKQGRGGDTFVGWDGSFWLAPTFPRSWKSEYASIVGTEVYDALTLDSAYGLHQVVTGSLPLPIFASAANQVRVAAGLEAPMSLPPVPETFGRELARIISLGQSGCDFFERCRAVAPGKSFAPEWAELAQGLFPEAFDRQRRAVRW